MEEEAAAAAGVKGMHPSLDESSPVQPTQEMSTDAAAAEEHSDAVMPVSEIMAMLQTMREEQLQTLNKIADGVQQLQSQVLVLGETATASDANTRLCLERLAGVEVRIGSAPMPTATPNNFQRKQSASQPQRIVGGGVGGGVSRAPPPPAPGPSCAPTVSCHVSWLDRKAEREPIYPHFMRSASQQHHQRVSPAKSTPTTIPASILQAAQTAVAGAFAPAALSSEPRAISAKEAAKEAKRKAFMEDRARTQERIVARKANTGPSANSMKPSPTPGPLAAATAAPTRTPTTPVTQQQTAQPQPRQPQGVVSPAGNNPFASGAGAGFVGHARASSAEPFFGSSGLLDRGSEGGRAGNATAGDEEAAWLERKRAQRVKKEREMWEAVERERKLREEEARLARERAEAKRLKEEEKARLLREAEEARERERKKREVEAKKQAKTRDVMSSLFDKGEDSGSLFGGRGAALPAGGSVLYEGAGGLSTLLAPASVAVVYDPPAEAAKASASAPVASSSSSRVVVGFTTTKDNVYSSSERYFLAKGRSIVSGKGGSRQRAYRCDRWHQGCTAYIRWTKQAQGEWKVSSLDDTHVNCGGATATATLRGVNDVIKGIVNNHLSISGPKLKKAAEAATGSTISLRSVQRAKQRLSGHTDAQEAGPMTKLRPYLKELQESSPGTVTDVEADADGAMTRCFVMTGKAVHVAQSTGVKAATMGSGSLKTAHHGQLLALSVKDDNNKILLVAFAIVDKEDEASYTYFLRNCMKSAAFASTFNSADMTIFIDGDKGSPPALKTCLPNVQTYRCLQHYLKSAPAIGADLVDNAYNAARAPSEAQFHSFMGRVQREKPATYNHLMTVLPLSLWTHHACKQGTRIGDTVTSNNVESLISMVSTEVRDKMPLLMVESIVDRIASKCAARAKTGSTSGELYTPHAVKTFDTERTLSDGLVVTDYGSDTFKVESFGGVHSGSNTVDLKFGTPGTPEEGEHTMECTCSFPARHGIPCRHVLAAAKHLSKMGVARQLIDKGYNAEKYRAAYGNKSFGIRPPSLATLVIDPTLFPPKWAKNTAGSSKGKRKRKRMPSNGEHNTSSRNNTRTPVPSGAVIWGAAGTEGASLSQPTLSQLTLSQPTASQPAASQPTASQPTASQLTTSQPTASQPTASQQT